VTRSAWLRSRLDWLRARDLRLMATLVAIGVLALIFLRIGNEVSAGATDRIDRAILLAFRNSPSDPIGSPVIEAAVMHISALGSGAVTTLVVIIATLFFALAGRWRYAIFMVACAAGTAICMSLLKGLYERPRPTVVTQLDPPGGLSFPSGHSMISAALYVTLGVLIARALPTRRLRVFAVATGAFLTMIIGLSRLYLGVHYPTDVLAGWTAGGAWALLCGVVINVLGRRGVADLPASGAEPDDRSSA
jgi:undecaprenyl-diphosphatase